MRIFQYAVAYVVEVFFFIFLALLVVAPLIKRKSSISRRHEKLGYQRRPPSYGEAPPYDQWHAIPGVPSVLDRYGPQPPNVRQAKSPLWERMRSMYYGNRIDRLAVSVERKLVRKQRRAERWHTRHRLD